MAGQRRARTGRGWDAAPRRPIDESLADGRPTDGGARSTTGGQWWPDGTPVVDPEADTDGGGRLVAGSSLDPSDDGLSAEQRAEDEAYAAAIGYRGGRRGSTTGRRSGRTGRAGSSGRAGEGFGRRGTGGAGGSGRGGAHETSPPDGDPAERAREICLRLLSVRPRTRAELAAALAGRGIEADVVATVLDRYGEVGIIDDAAFARAWVTSRHHGRGLARRALADELRRKGVDAEAAGTALDEVDADTEAQTARILVERKLRTDRGGPPEATFRRLVGMLARKGYSAGLATKVVKDALRDRAEALDEAAIEEAILEEAAMEDPPTHRDPG